MALRRKTRKKSSSSSSSGSTSGKQPTGKARPSGVVALLSNRRALRRVMLAAKIIGPTVAAGALRASTSVRGALDERRARQLGVPVEDVAAYKGPIGEVQARINGLSSAVTQLRARRGTDITVLRFVETSTARLGELSAAATATASMPPSTRRSALRAVSANLDRLDSELMTFLVGPKAA